MRSVLLVLVVSLTTVSAAAQGPNLDRARRHFEAGSKAFAAGEFPRAELEFRAALAITRDPLLYYNVAQAQQQRGHLEAAIKSYRAYLAGVPEAEDRAEVEKQIRKLDEQLNAPAVPPPLASRVAATARPDAAPASPPDDDGRARRQSAWIAGGASVALLAAGVAMSALSSTRSASADALLGGRDDVGQPIRFADVADRYNGYRDDAAKFGGVAIGMYAAAAVGAGLTVYLFLTSRPATGEKPHARLRLRPEISPRTAGLVAGMEF